MLEKSWLFFMCLAISVIIPSCGATDVSKKPVPPPTEEEESAWDAKERDIQILASNIERMTVSGKRDLGQLVVSRKKIDAIAKELISARKTEIARLDGLHKRESAQEAKMDYTKFQLAVSLYCYSFCFEPGVGSTHEKVLNEAHDILEELAFLYENKIIDIFLLNGRVLWELRRFKEAANNLSRFIDQPAKPDNAANTDNRKYAYYQGVEGFIKDLAYKECVLLGLRYFAEFPIEKGKVSFRDRAIGLNLSKGLIMLAPKDYGEIVASFGLEGTSLEEAKRILSRVELEEP